MACFASMVCQRWPHQTESIVSPANIPQGTVLNGTWHVWDGQGDNPLWH